MDARLASPILTSLRLATTTSSTQQPIFAAAAQEMTPISQKPSQQFVVTGTLEAPALSKAVIVPNYLLAHQHKKTLRLVATCLLLGDGLLVIQNLTIRW